MDGFIYFRLFSQLRNESSRAAILCHFLGLPIGHLKADIVKRLHEHLAVGRILFNEDLLRHPNAAIHF